MDMTYNTQGIQKRIQREFKTINPKEIVNENQKSEEIVN